MAEQAALQTIPDYIAPAIARLPSYEANDPNWKLLITSLFTSCNRLETTLIALYGERAVTTAFGVQLDNLGTILNVPRAGLTDSAYSLVLLGAAAKLGNSGEIPVVNLGYAALWSGALELVDFEYQPATIEMQVYVPTDPSSIAGDNLVIAGFNVIRAAGVQAILSVGQGTGFQLADKAIVSGAGDGPIGGTYQLADKSVVSGAGDGPLGNNGLARHVGQGAVNP